MSNWVALSDEEPPIDVQEIVKVLRNKLGEP